MGGKFTATPAVAAVLACALLLTAGVVTSEIGWGRSAAWAAWGAATANAGNQFGTAATFPDYPTSVTTDGAWAYHREEESPSSSATLAAADSSGFSRPGTFNGTTNGPSTSWKFDENAGVTVADSSGAANPGTLVGSPTWNSGQSGQALSLNGSSTYVAGAGPAVRTNASLSVAAWVYLASKATGSGAAVSQNGTHTYGFTLGFSQSADKWTFAMTDSDIAAPVEKIQTSVSSATGVWTHLVGVYYAAWNQIQLYVNGALSGTATKTVVWDATGALQVGRAYANDAWGSYFNGKVDDARVYNRALSATEVANLASSSPLTTWDFSEGNGTTTADAGSVGNVGTFGSGAGAPTWVAGRTGSGVSLSGGANGYVESALPAVETRSSFSVSVWAYLSSASPAGTVRSLVAQSGGSPTIVSSAFLLGGDTANKWTFRLPQSNTASPVVDSVSSNSAAATDTWVHLTAVYDMAANAGAGSLALYVNGVLQAGTSQHTAAHRWRATGSLQVGRALWDSTYQYPWVGTVDSLRLYQRALSQADVTALLNGTEPAASFTEAAMTAGIFGALRGTASGSTAVAFAGDASAYNATAMTNPTDFTVECWFRVSGTLGGELMGFYQTASGVAAQHDRQLYLDSGGRLTFGTWVGSAVTIRSAAGYQDDLWHHVAASLGPAGMRLYVDGGLVAASANTAALNTVGYWRWGGGDLTGWPNRPADDLLTGSVDEVAIYASQLTDLQISRHYQRNY